MAADMTQKQFDAALKRHEIRHAGPAWNEGSYIWNATTMPVKSPFGGYQITVTSRRALLAELIRRKEHDDQLRDEREQIRSLPRGARVIVNGRPGYVIEPWAKHGQGGENGGAGLVVSSNGHRMKVSAMGCRMPTGKWCGPETVRDALLLERAIHAARIAEIETLIEDMEGEAR